MGAARFFFGLGLVFLTVVSYARYISTTAKQLKGMIQMATFTQAPEIGMGVTFGAGSDSYPGTIVAMTAKSITVQRDDYRVVSGSFMTNDAVVEITPNTSNPTTVYTLRKNGKYIAKGCSANAYYAAAAIGGRRYYQDPSF